VQPDQVSVNVVPYSTQVNAGAALLGQFTHTAEHSYSHCLDFEGTDFDSMTMTPAGSASPKTYQLAGHFDPWSGYWGGTFAEMASNGYTPSWVCRTEPDFEIRPWSNNITDIHTQINNFTARGNTSIDVAVKWGAALLDPSTRDVFTALRGTVVSTDFPVGRPYDHDPNDDVLKFIVVMTDGINTTQYMLRDTYRSGLSGVLRDPDSGRYSWPDEEVDDQDGDGNWNEDFWLAKNYNVSGGRYWDNTAYDSGTTGNLIALTWPELFNEMSLSHRAYSHFYQRYYNANHYHDNYWRGNNSPRTGVNAGTKDTRLNNICTQAKNNDVIVFSVGFEVTDASAVVMQNCASSANHFYRVDGTEIEFAFTSIANQINQLKLTQ
ncbi:MAG: hypothetical protein AAGO57_01030, partial [Pseudomonadota bacterium]